MTTSDDVLRILDLLHAAGVDVWLDGGWGVDALLREQTRPHDDLDIAMKHEDASNFMRALGEAGFGLLPGGTAMNFVVMDGGGSKVDVHLVDVHADRLNDQGMQIYGPNGLEYEVGSLAGHGVVSGRPVPCCTAEFQIKSHAGYELDENDFRDVMALCRRFGLALPQALNHEVRSKEQESEVRWEQ